MPCSAPAVCPGNRHLPPLQGSVLSPSPPLLQPRHCCIHNDCCHLYFNALWNHLRRGWRRAGLAERCCPCLAHRRSSSWSCDQPCLPAPLSSTLNSPETSQVRAHPCCAVPEQRSVACGQQKPLLDHCTKQSVPGSIAPVVCQPRFWQAAVLGLCTAGMAPV